MIYSPLLAQLDVAVDNLASAIKDLDRAGNNPKCSNFFYHTWQRGPRGKKHGETVHPTLNLIKPSAHEKIKGHIALATALEAEKPVISALDRLGRSLAAHPACTALKTWPHLLINITHQEIKIALRCESWIPNTGVMMPSIDYQSGTLHLHCAIWEKVRNIGDGPLWHISHSGTHASKANFLRAPDAESAMAVGLAFLYPSLIGWSYPNLTIHRVEERADEILFRLQNLPHPKPSLNTKKTHTPF